jgi:hypothetical protein
MPVISDDSLIALQQLLAIADRLELDLPTACSLAGPIKTYGQGADEAGPQFDRLFNSRRSSPATHRIILRQPTEYRVYRYATDLDAGFIRGGRYPCHQPCPAWAGH